MWSLYNSQFWYPTDFSYSKSANYGLFRFQNVPLFLLLTCFQTLDSNSSLVCNVQLLFAFFPHSFVPSFLRSIVLFLFFSVFLYSDTFSALLHFLFFFCFSFSCSFLTFLSLLLLQPSALINIFPLLFY